MAEAKKVHVLTVGGSCKPIVNAIRITEPDFVYFICSSGSSGSISSKSMVDGSGSPCREQEKDGSVRAAPSIIAQLGLEPEKYQIVEIADPDDFEECHEKLSRLKEDIENRFSDSYPEVIANYTGGTKTMSAALVAFSLSNNWEVQCNVGPRRDLEKVRSGDMPMFVGVSRIRLYQNLQIVASLVEGYHYGEAAEIFEHLIKDFRYVPRDDREKLIKWRSLCLGFSEWDYFHHEQALTYLEPYGSFTGQWLAFLKRLTGAKNSKKPPYEEVEDLLMNAERRAAQKRFDDAVARLYRAVERLAQIRLEFEHEINTSNVDLNRVPESIRGSLISDEDGKVKIGLKQAYEVLAAFENEPIGKLYQNREKKLTNALKKRNFSILAHGNEPINEATYSEVSEEIVSFIEKAFDVLKYKRRLQQFPKTLPDLPHGLRSK